MTRKLPAALRAKRPQWSHHLPPLLLLESFSIHPKQLYSVPKYALLLIWPSPFRCPGHKPKSGKVLPIAGLLFLPPKDRSSRLPWWSQGLTPDSTVGGSQVSIPVWGNGRSCKFWGAAKRQVNLFFLHSHHQLYLTSHYSNLCKSSWYCKGQFMSTVAVLLS